MAAPLAIKPASEAAQGAVKVLSTDIVTVEGRVYRRRIVKEPYVGKGGKLKYRKVETLEPIDLTFHVNPVGIGLGLAGTAVALFLGAGRLALPAIGGEVELYRGPFHDAFEAWLGKSAARREARESCIAAGGIWEDIPGEGPAGGHCTIPGTKTCEELFELYKAARDRGDRRAAASYGNRAKEMGCEWAR